VEVMTNEIPQLTLNNGVQIEWVTRLNSARVD
jgi:hypothetical protein